MEKTLDSIRPSENGELSYLYGRDPSVLAYSQRMCPKTDVKKNLFSLYESQEFNCTDRSGESVMHGMQTLKVYLRIKPFPKHLEVTEKHMEAYQIINSTTLHTRLPVLDSSIKAEKEASNIICKNFTFTQTFGPEATQAELFEQTVKPQMVDFLSGQDATIMSYGTTSSGKSYTLQGTVESPGIIPRALEFVFSNIVPKSTPSYKPIHYCDVISLDAVERVYELEAKTKVLTFASSQKHHYTNAYKQMQKLLHEESPIRQSESTGVHYSVWVSFAEIYNETVFDLLSSECHKKRTPLKLVTDSHGRTFIKGLKTVCVNSGSEAYQILMAGQYNLKVAATALNAKSSRSHCIFTIKLLQYHTEDNPDAVEVSTFTFCDLAGAERLKKTLNIGERLKEAQNINTSLLVLGRCLKSIREGQLMKQKTEIAGPFRESKLTRLFQWALSGKEHISMIVNINPAPNFYRETQDVLKFSAIAQKIVIQQKQKVKIKRKSRFSQIVTQTIRTTTDWDITEIEESQEDIEDLVEEDSKYVHLEDYQNVINENERLKKEIADLKNSALLRDFEIRQEMANTYTAMLKKLETEWKNRMKCIQEQQEDTLEWSTKQIENFYKQKLEQLNSRKRKRESDDEDDDKLKNIEALEEENSHLMSKVTALQNTIKTLRDLNEKLSVEKNKASFDLKLTQEELKTSKSLIESLQKDISSEEDTTFYVDNLKSQLSEKQEQIKKLKEFLDEAKEEYITMATHLQEKESQLQEKAEIIAHNEDKIDDLEEQFEYVNVCLNERNKTVETLERKLEQQDQTLSEKDNMIQQMQDKINELEKENATLLERTEHTNSVHNNTEQINLIQNNSEQNNSEQINSEQNNSEQTDSKQNISKQNDSEQNNSEQNNSEQNSSEQNDSEENNLEPNDLEQNKLENIKTEQLENTYIKEELSLTSPQHEKHLGITVKQEAVSDDEETTTKETVFCNNQEIAVKCETVSDIKSIHSNKVEEGIRLEDKSCQVNLQDEASEKEIRTKEVYVQTCFVRESVDEVASQTSFTEVKPEAIEDKLIKNENVKTKTKHGTTSVKKSTRKKKLYHTDDEKVKDVEIIETCRSPSPPPPPAPARNLRSRKK